MKIKQSKEQQSTILNGSCHRLSPKILLRKHFGGPPIGVTRSCLSLLLFIISTVICGFLLLNNNTSALTYSNNTPVNFTFEPSINVSLSSTDLIIEDLTPGSSSDSNIINIGISTNNITGYTLSASAGDGTNYTDTKLINDKAYFASLATNASISDLNNLTPGYWGYAYATSSDNNNWSWSNYSGLPYYASSPKEIASTHINKASTIQFKIAAKADNTQLAGEYNNVINFYAITNPSLHYYMQDFTLSQCQNLANDDNFIVYDRRDENDYTVRYINGQCWMTQNLRTTGTISAEYSNFTGNDFNVSEYSLDANDATYANHCDSTNGYNYACAKDSENAETGVWYNYYSATAGTINNRLNTIPATEDICPAGWHLPSGPNTVEGTDFNRLIGNTVSGYQKPTINLLSFNAVTGGYYADGSIVSNNGYWWSTIVQNEDAASRYILGYSESNFKGDSGSGRLRGRFVRCVMNDG